MKESLLLINPPSPELVDDKTSVPLGILYIASFVRKIGYPIKFVDFAGNNDAKLEYNHKYYGFTSVTPQWSFVHQKIKEIKNHNSNAIIIVGGPHPTALPEACLNDGADIVVVGEGETAIEEILMKNNHSSIIRSERITNLDFIPFPARDLLDGYKKHTIVCSRGCPFSCKFCGSPNIWGNRVVSRSVKNVENEIDELILQYKIDYLGIRDETFGMNKQWALDFCEMIKRKRISWEVQTRSTLCTVNFLSIMKDAGCVFVSLGIESGSKKMLQNILKKETPEDNLQAIRNLKEAQINCRGFFIVGLPGETDETVEETEKFILEAKKIGLTNISLFTFVPFPGSQFYKESYKHVNSHFDNYYLITKTGKGSVVEIHDKNKITKWNEKLSIVVNDANDVKRYT